MRLSFGHRSLFVPLLFRTDFRPTVGKVLQARHQFGKRVLILERVMPSRRKKPDELSPAQQERFLAAATELHLAVVEPLIPPQSEHYQALQRVHAALLKGIEEVTGTSAPWTRQSSS